MCDLFFIYPNSKKLSFASKEGTLAYCTILLLLVFFKKKVFFFFIVTAITSPMSISLFCCSFAPALPVIRMHSGINLHMEM